MQPERGRAAQRNAFAPILLAAATVALVAPTVHTVRRLRPVGLVGLEDSAPLLPEVGGVVTGSLIASILLAMVAILLAARPNS